MTHSQDLTVTITGLIICICLGLVSFRRHFAKHDKLAPRMVPWMIICLGCVATGFMLFVHFVNLFGFQTGRGG